MSTKTSAAADREDTPLIPSTGGDIERGFIGDHIAPDEPAPLPPIKAGDLTETLIGIFAAITGKCEVSRHTKLFVKK